LPSIVNRLLDAVDADAQIERAKTMFNTATPDDAQIEQAAQELTVEACAVFDNPRFRETLIEIHRRNEQTIDTVSQDAVIAAGFDEAAKERARRKVESFKQFIEQNKDELTALQILYNLPYARRQLTYQAIDELAKAIQRPPYHLSADELWQAYEQLDRANVRGAGAQKKLSNLVALVRYAIGADALLEPFSVKVDRKFAEWLAQAGSTFTPEQCEWLTMIKDQIANSVEINWDDFDLTPFSDKGGRVKAYNLFGQGLDNLMQELNTVLVA
jgi:type I restriction enzyme R subunit